MPINESSIFDTFDFGDAIYFMKNGNMVSRLAWIKADKHLAYNSENCLVGVFSSPHECSPLISEFMADSEDMMAEDWFIYKDYSTIE